MIPPQHTSGPDHGRRRGPQGWSGALVVVFGVLAILFAYLLLTLETPAGAGGRVLLAVGTLVSLGVAGLLLRWRIGR